MGDDARRVKSLRSGQLGQRGHERCSDEKSDTSAEHGEKSAFDEELGQNIFVSCAQCLAQADLAGTFGHRYQHDVDDADRPQGQSHKPHDTKKIIHGIEDLAYALRILNRVPIFECVFQFGIEAWRRAMIW